MQSTQKLWACVIAGILAVMFTFAFLVQAHAVITPTVMVGIRPNADGLCGQTTPVNCEANLLAREAEIGRPFAIASSYGPFDIASDPFMEWAVATGHTPMFTMQHALTNGTCVSANDIAAGVYDSQIMAWATYFGGYPTKVILRLFPEMNKPHQACLYSVDPVVDPVTAGAEFQAAWRHAYAIAHPIAPNIVWDFSPGNDAFNDPSGNPLTLWQDFDPGTAYTDYTGSQVYNGSATSGDTIQSSARFTNFYAQAATRGKPIYLSETGAIDNPNVVNDPQQRWYYSMSTQFAVQYPLVIGIVVFDVNANGGDYRLTGAGETAFINMAAKKYFSKMAP